MIYAVRKFPTDCKVARATPIYKNETRDDCSRLFIYKHQSGFRSLQSVTTSLMACKNDWYLNIDKGRYTGLV